jgi:hypothetical protein
MGSNFQMAGRWIFVLECDPNWTPCEKAQVRSKAADLNMIAPLQRDPNYNDAVRARGDSCAGAWNREFAARRAGANTPQSPLLGNDPNNHPNGGTDSDFADPCMADEISELEPAAQQEYIDSLQPDHTHELQLGGNVQGPMKYMSGRVNGSLGGQFRGAGTRPDPADPSRETRGHPVDEFQVDASCR